MDTSCDECTDHDISKRSGDEMQNESENKKEGNISKRKNDRKKKERRMGRQWE